MFRMIFACEKTRPGPAYLSKGSSSLGKWSSSLRLQHLFHTLGFSFLLLFFRFDLLLTNHGKRTTQMLSLSLMS